MKILWSMQLIFVDGRNIFENRILNGVYQPTDEDQDLTEDNRISSNPPTKSEMMQAIREMESRNEDEKRQPRNNLVKNYRQGTFRKWKELGRDQEFGSEQGQMEKFRGPTSPKGLKELKMKNCLAKQKPSKSTYLVFEIFTPLDSS
ncbi:hypothetical protein HHI36_000140 [Cryptolaemus montrouzieri]|uniref:Uncharacterized protein n=1 Tax=Cryptolaemus montrouzieri TaxID=559131 RepID=A0ABD2P4J2_9CUCU